MSKVGSKESLALHYNQSNTNNKAQKKKEDEPSFFITEKVKKDE